jgi:hypothetical protein
MRTNNFLGEDLRLISKRGVKVLKVRMLHNY